MSNIVSLIEERFLQPEESDHRYDKSPFKHLKSMLPKQKGKRFEHITECVIRKLGYDVRDRVSPDHDLIIDNIKCEIKGATLVKGKDIFSFLQIRADQDYQELVFTLFYPHDMIILRMDKELVKTLINNGTFKKQHGGNKAESGTYCYYGNEKTLEALGATRVNGKSA
jgi:hypothetical protein